jgi:hypothetical protein
MGWALAVGHFSGRFINPGFRAQLALDFLSRLTRQRPLLITSCEVDSGQLVGFKRAEGLFTAIGLPVDSVWELQQNGVGTRQGLDRARSPLKSTAGAR